MGQATVLNNRETPPKGDLDDPTCGVLGRLGPLARPDSLLRFIVGDDQQPVQLGQGEIAEQLGDPFAATLMAKGTFPRTAVGVFEALDQVVGAKDSLGANSQRSFILGEGSQIPFGDAPKLNRGLRFVITRGNGPDGPDLIVSAFVPDQPDDIELMAWDATSGGFNFYRSLGEEGAWVFAGNSRHALVEPSAGKGPFESHKGGNFLMKELRAPWINWHSPDANIFATVFGPGDTRAQHPWFVNKEPQGALVCETAVARPAIKRWTEARFAQAIGPDGTVARPAEIVAPIVGTPTVNLISSHTEGRAAVAGQDVDLPQTFFVDSEALTEILGLPAPPNLSVSGEIYAKSLESFDAKLDDENGFSQPGDAHFAFVVPERAAEDQAILRKAIEVGLATERLAACLLMTDFPNPVFSGRRAALFAHMPTSATIANGSSDFSQRAGDAIQAAAEGTAPNSPEREFAERWTAGDAWKDAFAPLLTDYYNQITAALSDQAAFDDYFRLAETRRNKVREMPIFENPLLFPHTNIPEGNRVMRADGTVATEAES